MISLTKQPIKYTPANNPIVFTLSGNSNDLVLFKLQLNEATTNATVYTGNIYPTPANPTKASVNLSNQLSALVRSQVDNTNDIVITKPRNIIGYTLNATEYGVTSGGTLSAMTSGYTTDAFHAFESGLDILNFSKYQFNDYVVHSGYTGTTKFLTYQPNNKAVNQYSTEQLYFLQSGFTTLDIQVVAGSNTYDFSLSGATLSGAALLGIVQRQDDQATFLFYFKGNMVSVGDVVTVTYYYDVAMTPVVFTSTVQVGWTAIDVIGDLYSQIDADGRFVVSLTHAGIGITCTTVGAVALDGLVTVSTSSVGIAEIDKMLRIQASPKKLIQAGVNLSGLSSYTVKVKASSTGTTLSETRTYKIEPTDCNLDYVNVLFTNSLGGVDSIQLVQPQESATITKLSIKKNNINLDNPDVFKTDGVYNTTDEVYNVSSKYNVKLYTKPLNDEQSIWLAEMVKSKHHYIELVDGDLLPVQLVTSNYSIQKKKYRPNELIQVQFEFALSDNYTTGEIIINQ